MSLSLFQVPLDFRREEPSSDGAAEGFLGLEEPPLVSLHKPSYGFDKGFSEFFTAYSVQDLAEICDLPDPDHTPVERRRELRVLGEQRDFVQGEPILSKFACISKARLDGTTIFPENPTSQADNRQERKETNNPIRTDLLVHGIH